MTSNPQQWQYVFSPPMGDMRSTVEERVLKLHPSDDPSGNVIEITVTNTQTGAVDKRFFRLTEVRPDWENV